MNPDPPTDTPRFLTTRWSLVRAAHGVDEDAAAAALRELCEAYWYPLYAFARRRGMAPDDALDAAQAFLARLLDGLDLGGADPERGRFRSYLLGAFRHHLSGEARRAAAEKRGGGRAVLSLDAQDAEGRFRAEPAGGESPERAFERAWAEALLARALDALRAEYGARGDGATFEALRAHLTPGAEPRPVAELAAELSRTETALKVAAHRLRRRFAEAVRAEVAATVENGASVEDELGELFRALEGPENSPGGR